MLQYIAALEKQPKWLVLAIGVVLVFLLGVIDYATGSELEVTLFYLLPIALAAGLVGRRAGLLISLLAILTWFVANIMAETHQINPVVMAWNTILLFGFFVIITYTLAALTLARRRQEELTRLIVHDLRSPLSISVMSLNVFDDSYGQMLTPPQRELIEVCKMSYGRMMTLINSILDMARLESGHMPLDLSDVDVASVIEVSTQSLEIEARQSNVSFALDLSPDAPAVFADRTITERILINLLGNALKYSPKASQVLVSAAPGPNNTAVFRIEDHGRGIPPDMVGSVFDRFAQADTRSDRNRWGSGLGLSFCRLAVEAQGGHIWIESEVGRGTTISFTLPVGKKR